MDIVVGEPLMDKDKVFFCRSVLIKTLPGCFESQAIKIGSLDRTCKQLCRLILTHLEHNQKSESSAYKDGVEFQNHQ